ncbi:MAG: C40 family peptidase [Verrucomicrobia bacterium]|nr:C40 family peptidase [Verrucomicrobiota bacterium]
MRYLVLALAYSLLAFAVSEVRGDDNPLDAVYRSLDKWGRNVRQQLQEEATPTPAKKRIHHHSSTLQHHASPSPSPKIRSKEEEADDTPKAKKSSGDDEEDSSPQKHAKHRAKSEDSNPEPTPEEAPKPSAQNQPVAVSSLDPSKLKDFDGQPPGVQDLIRSALALTQRNLAYTYGSADPASGGMDCSGFIYYVLSNSGFKDVPRQSSDQYLWVRKNGNFHSVLSRNANTFELEELRPGDLMFWSGTYRVDRDVPVTHVMIYLGKEKGTNKRVMVGASDGRSYNGERRFGVSVFDFKLPNGAPNKSDPDLVARFEGYSAIPGLREEVYSVKSATPAPTPVAVIRKAPLPEQNPFLPVKAPQPTPTPPKLITNGD